MPYGALRQRLQANGSKRSPRRALAILRQLQQHRVDINSKAVTGTGRIQPDQRDLLKALAIDEPHTKTAV